MMISNGTESGNFTLGPATKALSEIRASSRSANAKWLDETVNELTLRRLDEFDRTLGVALRNIRDTQEALSRVLRENEQLTSEMTLLKEQLKKRFAGIDAKINVGRRVNNGLATATDLRTLIPAQSLPDDFQPVSFGDFRDTYPKLRPVVIDGICREGETVNVIASSKVGKSWLSMDMAMSVAIGGRWLPAFINKNNILTGIQALRRARPDRKLRLVAPAGTSPLRRASFLRHYLVACQLSLRPGRARRKRFLPTCVVR